MVASNQTTDAPHTTRQMLDDLDALMEQMLSVPVSDPEAASPVAPKRSATLTLLEPVTSPTPPPVRKPVATHVASPPAVAAPTAPSYYATVPTPPEPTLEPITNEVLPPSLLPRITQLIAEVPDEGPAPLAWIYAPLWWINVAFDGCTHLLGGPGAFLRSAGGRLIVGLLGVVLGVLAAGWYAKDGWGWSW